MKKFTFNKQFMVLMFLLLNCFASYAADEDLITKQITLNLTEAGTLPNKIGSSKKNLITNLKIIGEINGTDLRFIREMAGGDVHGDRTSGNLEDCKGLKSIYIFAEDVPTIGTGAFDGCDSKNCTLYVPNGTYDAYWLSEFGYFENIVEFDATSIHNTVATPKAQETARYAVNGQRLTAPIKGINLVKYSDGTVKKEFVK